MKTVKLGDICNFKSSTPTKILPYVGMEDIESNSGRFLGNLEPREVKSTTSYFDDTCVLYGKLRPYLNKVFVPDFEGHCSTEFVTLRPNLDLIDRQYLWSFLISPDTVNTLSTYTTGARMPRASLAILKGLDIPLPSLKEQQRIVARLDASFEKIARAEALMKQNLDNVAALQKSILHKYLSASDSTHRLEAICRKIFAGGDVPKGHMSKIRSEQYSVPILTNGEKNDGLYGYTDEARVFDPSVTVSARGTIGFSLVRNENFYPAVRLIVLIPNEEIVDVNYLGWVIKSMDFANTGTSIPQLTVPMIKQYEVSLPSLNTQKEIVTKLDESLTKTRQIEAKYTEKLTKLTALRNSLLNQAFSTTNKV